MLRGSRGNIDASDIDIAPFIDYYRVRILFSGIGTGSGTFTKDPSKPFIDRIFAVQRYTPRVAPCLDCAGVFDVQGCTTAFATSFFKLSGVI
jgi:hypothetical protein